MAPRLLAAVALLASPAHSHYMLQYPPSRSFDHSPWGGKDGYYFEAIDANPYAYNSGGIKMTIDRAGEKASAAVERYGGKDMWPPYQEDRAPNGNMIEPNDIAKRQNICGDPKLGGDDSNLPYSIQTDNFDTLATFVEGQVVEMDAVIASWHAGHIECSVCDTTDSSENPGGIPNQGCFNKHPLNRAMNDGDASPIDSNYPGRYYVDPPCRGENGEVDQDFFKDDLREVGGTTPYRMFMRFVLPEGLTCKHCVLQCKYFTAHTCKYPGYDEFNPPSWPSACAPNKEDWFYPNPSNDELCGIVPRAYPEEFLQCSDIEIASSGGSTETEDEPVADEPVAQEEEPVSYDTSTEETEKENDTSTEETEKEDSFIYHGCVEDSKADRVMERMVLPSELEEKMTGELCMDVCEGDYKFSGTQWGHECWCGGDDTDHDLHGESEKCNEPCTGDSNETCGGYDAMDVREFV